jgi:hypothetical protein
MAFFNCKVHLVFYQTKCNFVNIIFYMIRLFYHVTIQYQTTDSYTTADLPEKQLISRKHLMDKNQIHSFLDSCIAYTAVFGQSAILSKSAVSYCIVT